MSGGEHTVISILIHTICLLTFPKIIALSCRFALFFPFLSIGLQNRLKRSKTAFDVPVEHVPLPPETPAPSQVAARPQQTLPFPLPDQVLFLSWRWEKRAVGPCAECPASGRTACPPTPNDTPVPPHTNAAPPRIGGISYADVAPAAWARVPC